MQKRIIAMILYAVFVLASLSGCSTGRVSGGLTPGSTQTEDAFGRELKQSYDFVRVAENTRFRMDVRGSAAELQITDKLTGMVYGMYPEDVDSDPLGQSRAISNLKSAIQIEYVDDTDTMGTLNTYETSIAEQAFTYAQVENGLRITYTLKEPDTTYTFPVILTAERFQEFISRMDESDAQYLRDRYVEYKADAPENTLQQLLNTYPGAKGKHVYVLLSSQMADFVMKNIEDIFSSAGYEWEDLETDYGVLGVEMPELPREFSMSVEYTLTPAGFSAKVLRDSLSVPAGVYLTRICLLSGFGAAGARSEGYILLPDGSGCLIDFQEDNTRFDTYRSPVYGQDYAIPVEQEDTLTEQIYMPVFGVKNGDNGFLAIIRQGEAAAHINADVAGKIHSYNVVYADFTVTANVQGPSPINSQQYIYSFANEAIASDMEVEYRFLLPGEADYVGMAAEYRDYLIESGVTAKGSAEHLPFLLGVIGSVDYDSSFLMIPTKSTRALTTYQQAASILQELENRGVKNILLQYSAWANGGFNGTLNNKVRLIRQVGDRSELAQLGEQLQQKGYQLYPEVDFLYAKDVGFPTFNRYTQLSRNINGDLAVKYDYNLVSHEQEEDAWKWILKPTLLEGWMSRYLDHYEQFHIPALSAASLGSDLSSDFNGNEFFDRTQVQQIISGLLKQMDEAGYSLMIKGGNAYTYPYVDFIQDAPLDSSRYYMESQSVPFYQIVLHGLIPYASMPINYESDAQMAFLRCLEYGAVPAYEWTYASNASWADTVYQKYATDYTAWLDTAAEQYREADEILKSIQDYRITDHCQLSDQVFATSYDNGTVIYVNYSEEAFVENGISVPAKGYLCVQGGAGA